MNAVTISQPFASLIASGAKWIENRTWYTAYRGPLAIHAGSGKQYLDSKELRDYPTGAIIAVADLVACLSLEEIQDGADDTPSLFPPGCSRTWQQIVRHSHCEGPFCWVLENVRPVTPVEIPGKLGLWRVPSDVAFVYEEVTHGS